MFLTKLLPVFAYPLGLAIVVGIAGVLLRFFLPRLSAVAVLASLIGLWAASMPAVSNLLLLRLEAAFPPVVLETVEPAEVAVVLGGVLDQPVPPRLRPDLGEAVERVTEAARLYRLGKVRLILVSGGNLPWETLVAPEAELIADFLVELGVPREAVVIEGGSRNTYENAVNSAAIFRARGWKSGFLVTSAFHMLRAERTFRQAGMQLTPVPVDVRGKSRWADSLLDFLPDSKALSRTTDLVKEGLALIVYRLRGWA